MRLTRKQRNQLDDLADDMYRADKRKDGDACDEIQEKIDKIQRGGIRPFRKGDKVEVKKHPDEKWKEGEVITLNPVSVECNGNPTSYKSIRLSTKELNHPLMIGDTCEGVDVSGNWWTITIQEVLKDGSYQAVVDDDEKTVWSSVHPEKMRALGSDTKHSKKSKKDKKEKSRKDKKSRKKSSKKRKSSTPKKRHHHHSSTDSDTDSSKKGKHGKKKPGKVGSPKQESLPAPTTNPQVGDIFKANNKYVIIKAMKNGKAACVATDGEAVSLVESDLAVIGQSRLQVPKISVKKTKDSAITVASGTHNSIILTRDLTGPSKAVACLFSFDSFPDSTETTWQIELNQDCKAKKCDPPDEPGEPGPFSFGICPSTIDWKTLECDDLPKIVKAGAQVFYYSSPLSDDSTGTIGRYERKADVIAAQQPSPSQGTEKPKEKECSYQESQAPILKPSNILSLIIDRSSRSLIWGVGGKVIRQLGIDTKQTYSVFVALSKGHSATIHPPKVGYRFQPCVAMADSSVMTTVHGNQKGNIECCSLQ
eukprot:TRINITY_DN6961_c1_g2_i1.p1 TRINITY_DN6961_c1_g2~~TRINITY_DN6961_c1_g2_i1.p1  ORF type:complete len:624 (+),score=95.98 TRINITY_DN6961_c1_g2_i1:270-1874(+)